MQMRYHAALHPVVKNNLYGLGRKKASIFFTYKKFLPSGLKLLQNPKENVTVKTSRYKICKEKSDDGIFFIFPPRTL